MIRGPQSALRPVRAHRGGWLLVELVVSVGLLALLLGAMMLAQRTLAKVNEFQLSRQRCIAAAEAQLDCIASTGRPMADADLARLWPGVCVTVQRTAGQGEWAGLELVKATATRSKGGPEAKVELARYVQPRKQ
ncbi:MAG: hypothetical protein ACE15C_17130 [Phycisphaerae bacterium]